MGWRGNQWPAKRLRPKLRKLSKEAKTGILELFEQKISSSAVLSALDVKVRPLRDRFYLEKPGFCATDTSEVENLGRITPVLDKKTPLLLDTMNMNGNWYEVLMGTDKEIFETIIYDTKGTFHGLGQLEKSLCKNKTISPLDIEMRDNYQFIFKETGEECTVQEVLYYVFGIPIPLIAEPREWYLYHRTPKIIKINKKMTSIKVEFSKLDIHYGKYISGICKYEKHGDKWDIVE